MVEYYGAVNFWFDEITRQVEAVNPRLARQLSSDEQRRVYESLSKYETFSVPAKQGVYIPPMSRLAGHALPRLFVDQLRSAENRHVPHRLAWAMEVVSASARVSGEPLGLLAHVAECFDGGAYVPSTQILRTVFSRVWLEQHGAASMLHDAKAVFELYAPKLWGKYGALSPQEKYKYELA